MPFGSVVNDVGTGKAEGDRKTDGEEGMLRLFVRVSADELRLCEIEELVKTSEFHEYRQCCTGSRPGVPLGRTRRTYELQISCDRLTFGQLRKGPILFSVCKTGKKKYRERS